MSIEPYDKERAAFMEEFEQLRPDLFYADVWSEDQKIKAVEMLRPTKIKTGMLTSIPMRCSGPRCHFAPSCPLIKENLAPEGSPCPIEMSMVQQFFRDYVEELSVDVSRMVEVSMVRDLVDQEIQMMRKTWMLSQEHFIQENVVGLDDEGNVITKKELHQAVEYEDKILKRKEKMRSALLATREARAKIGQAPADNAQVLSTMLDNVRKIERERERLLKAKLGIEEYDDYIEDADIVEESED